MTQILAEDRVVDVLAVCPTSRVFREDGERVRAEIERLWSEAGPVEVDFRNARIASVSFLDEGLALLALTHPVEVIQRHVKVVNMDPNDRRLLNDLLRARAKEREAGEVTSKA